MWSNGGERLVGWFKPCQCPDASSRPSELLIGYQPVFRKMLRPRVKHQKQQQNPSAQNLTKPAWQHPEKREVWRVGEMQGLSPAAERSLWRNVHHADMVVTHTHAVGCRCCCCCCAVLVVAKPPIPTPPFFFLFLFFLLRLYTGWALISDSLMLSGNWAVQTGMQRKETSQTDTIPQRMDVSNGSCFQTKNGV